jgi:general secretion pathway protein D
MYGVNTKWLQGVPRAAVFASLVLLLGSCSAIEKTMSIGQNDDASNAVTQADLTARSQWPLANNLRDPATPKSQIFSGEGDVSSAAASTLNPAPPGQEVVAQGADSYDLNFQNADINAVTKVLLGDILKLSYSVDPRVQGTISLSSGRPVAKAAILSLYESAAKIVNANVVKEGGIYKVVPIGEALGNGAIDQANNLTQGYGISVLPLRYVSAKAVLQAVDSFAAKPGMVKADAARNLLLIQGPSTERASAIEAATALDVDWMKGQSVGIFPVRNASPDTIIAELRNVFDSAKDGTAANLVRFQAINRLNAVLAVAQSDYLIRQTKSWVARLDHADYDNTTVRVYKLRFGNAKLVAAILKDVFTGQSGLGGLGSADLSQLTPGAGTRRATSSTTRSPTPNSPSTPSSIFNNPESTDNSSGGSNTDQNQQSSTSRTSTDIASLSTGGQSGPAPLPNVRITADIANNALLIYASRDQYKMVERAIFELDRAPNQVAIDVTVAEITLKNELQYGVEYYLRSGGAGKNQKGSIGFGTTQILQRAVPGANIVLGSNSDPRVVLSALEAVTDVKVLSAPSLVVLDNQTATLQVGDQVPVITQQATGVVSPDSPIVNSVERQDTGVILKVLPRVNANGVVNLEVTQEVSAVSSTDPTLGPTISKRKVQSSVAVTSGQTVLLGGLISSNSSVDRNGIPILMDIKVIGDLFATTDKKANRTELILFIRPQIIQNGLDAQAVSEELRSKLTTLGRGIEPGPKRAPSSRDAR